MSYFQKKHTFEDRLSESQKVLKKYPERVPIIIEKGNEKDDIETIDKNKYLVPRSTTLHEFVLIIRKRIHLEPSKTMFVIINSHLCPGTKTIGEIYEEDKDEDGFLYIKYTSENTFG